MSSVWALKTPLDCRSVLRTPTPTYCRPRYVVSLDAPTNIESGARATASSFTWPRSKTMLTPAFSALFAASLYSQNSM